MPWPSRPPPPAPPAAENPPIAEKAAPVEEPATPREAPPAPQARAPDPPAAVRPRETSASPSATSPSIANSPPVAASRPQGASRSAITQPPFPGLPRVEVVRETASAAEGRVAAYAVRLSDAMGRPVSGAEVMLLARMADGSVENIPLGSGAEPGSYHGAVPPGQSAPVDLRVRVMTNNRRVEIPLKP